MRSHHISALIWKDWRLISLQVMVYSVMGSLFVGINLIPGEAASFTGSLLVITVFVAFYSHIAIKSVINERKEKNHLFLMTLPLSARLLFFTKMLATWLVFFFVWCLFLAMVALVMIPSDHVPAIVLTLYALIFLLFIPAFAFILGVGLVSGSEGWTILAFVLCNTMVTVSINLLSREPEVQTLFSMGTVGELGLVLPSWTMAYVSGISLITISVLAITIAAGLMKKDYF